MAWTLDQLKKTKVGQLPENQAVLAIAHKHAKTINDLDTLSAAITKHSEGQALGGKAQRNAKGKRSVVIYVTIVRCGLRRADDDNIGYSYKSLRDAISHSLGVDDGDKWVHWQYGQSLTQGDQGTIVMIEVKGT